MAIQEGGGVIVIGNALSNLPQLTYLNLGNGNIGGEEAGTVAIGGSLQFLSNLTYLDLRGTGIGYTGDAGTIAIGEGLRNKTALTFLNLSDTFIGQHGSQGIELILQNVVREGLNLNLGGAVGIPWTTGSQALATLNAGPVVAACYQQRCFGGNVASQNTTTTQSAGTRRLMVLDNIAVEEEASAQQSTPTFFLTRWARAGRETLSRWTTRFTQATKTLIYDDLGDWLTKKLTDAAHEVVANNLSYFPNGNNPDVRDWPSGNLYVNVTTATGALPALPAAAAPALP